jgi:hypothetical protein
MAFSVHAEREKSGGGGFKPAYTASACRALAPQVPRSLRTGFTKSLHDAAEEGLAPPFGDADRNVIKVTSGGQPIRVGNSMVPMPALV